MSLRTAITQLAATGATVTGITTAFDVDDVPQSLKTAQLPALLHFPGGGTNDRLVFDNNIWTFKHRVRVILFYSPVAQGRLEDNLAEIVDLVGSYVEAIRDDDDLDGNVCDAMVTAYGEPGAFRFAEVDYHGVEFTVEVVEYVA